MEAIAYILERIKRQLYDGQSLKFIFQILKLSCFTYSVWDNSDGIDKLNGSKFLRDS